MRPPALAALVAALLPPHGADGWSTTISTAADMVCTTADGQPTQGINGPAVGTLGGAPNIRSGPPDGTCRLKLPAPAPITSVSFTYQYLTGSARSRPRPRARPSSS